MLGVSQLPDDLQVMLNRADERIRSTPDVCGEHGNGGLRSRQSIAAIIAAWEAMQTQLYADVTLEQFERIKAGAR